MLTSKHLPEISRFTSLLESAEMAHNPTKWFQKHFAELGETFLFHFGGVKKVVVTSNPDIIQHILKKNYQNYKKSEIQIKRLGHFLGSGLLTSHGEYWLKQRRIIQQGFTKNRLNSNIPVMHKVISKYFDDHDASNNNLPVDITSFMTDLTFKMVMKTHFTSSISDQEIKNISEAINDIQGFIIQQVVQPYLNTWHLLTGKQHHFEKRKKEANRLIMKIIHERRSSAIKYPDMLQVLLDVRYEDGEIALTDEQIMMESLQLIVAGHETSSTALTWILHLLAHHPIHLKKVTAEISELKEFKVFDMTLFSQLQYTIQVIEEALRMYPPFWMLDRECVEDDEINDFQIPANTLILLSIYGVQHSEKYWRNPEDFNPKRFEKQQKNAQIPFTYNPFGGGPRGCIGGNYAMIQILIILVNFIGRYDFQPKYDSPVDINPLIMLKPDKKIMMSLKKK